MSLVVVAIGVIADPYGLLMDSSVLVRFLFWIGAIDIGVALAFLMRAALLSLPITISLTTQDLLVSATMALFFYPIVMLVGSLLVDGFAQATDEYFTLGLATFGLVLTMSTIRRAMEEQLDSEPRHDRLLDRLECGKAGRVVRISSSDHHVVVALTDGTEHRLRMRLRDAVAEMDVERGFCIHRSHWVALASVDHVRNGGSKTQVQLTSGEMLPVGAKYWSALVEHGFVND